jgi:hypothetical protein
VDIVRAATALIRERRPQLPVEGPIQYDAAVDPKVARAKLPDSKLSGPATVFIFPDLNSGNNTYKAVQRATRAIAIGPVMQGLRKPVNDLSRGCTVVDIVNTIAITAIQAQELLKEAKERGVKLGVGHIERYNPAVLAVQSHLRDPKFIEVHRLAAYNPRGTDVDVVLDLMIHDLDLIRNRMKGRPARVQAVGIPVITDRVDIANARLEFEDGAIANVTASRVSAEKMRKLRVFQSDAYLSIDCLNKSVEMYRKKDGRIFPFPVDVVADREPLKAQLEGFLRAVIEDREPPISGIEGYQALELALWIRSEIDEHMRKVPIP